MKTLRVIELSLALVLIALRFRASAAEPELPPEIVITSRSTTHVHAVISDLPIDKFSALSRIHALFTVYFDGRGVADDKLKALALLRFTNLACVVFTDCPLVTDKGIDHLAQIPTLTSLGLRRMSITDAACDTMVSTMHLSGVNMPNCTNVTAKGLLKMAQSETMESLGFSVGRLTQEELLGLIRNAGPRINRMDIEIDPSVEHRLDLPALRQAGEAKRIKLYAVRNHQVRRL